MGPEQINPSLPGNEPELHLLLARDTFQEPLWKSLSRELDDFFFPKKLPPLKLESKPEPVKDIWGFYNNRKNGALGSTGVHVLIVGIVAAGTPTNDNTVKSVLLCINKFLAYKFECSLIFPCVQMRNVTQHISSNESYVSERIWV